LWSHKIKNFLSAIDPYGKPQGISDGLSCHKVADESNKTKRGDFVYKKMILFSPNHLQL